MTGTMCGHMNKCLYLKELTRPSDSCYMPGHKEDVQLASESVGEAQSHQSWVDGVPVDDGEERGENY